MTFASRYGTLGARTLLVLLVVGTLMLSGCSNAKPSITDSGGSDGLSANQIVVGGVASLSGPLTADFAPIYDGVNAYFDQVNATGGVYGRRLNLKYPLDDASDPSQDIDQVRNLISNFHVFAVVGVATPNFAGASLLANAQVPTFGMAINPGWSPSPNMFGVGGSYTSFSAPQTEVAFLAEQVHATKAAVVAYNVSQSQEGCQGVINGLSKFGISVVFQDLGIPAPAVDLSADVGRIKSSGATFVASCMDVSGNLLLSQDLHQGGLPNITQYWLDGYDPQILANSTNTALMDGAYFLISHAPFGVETTDPGAYPGMVQYFDAMTKYEPNVQPSEASLDGWISADLFVTGLRAAGKDVTRAKLVAAINNLTSYTANGLLPPVDWRISHTGNGSDCQAFVQAVGTQFVSRFGSGGSVFTCFPPNTSQVPIVPLNGVPGLPGVTFPGGGSKS